MNKLAYILFFTFGSLGLFGQGAIDDFFEDYQDDENFSIVFVSPKMFEMVSKVAGDETLDGDLKEITKDLKGLKILKTEVNALEIYKEAKKRIPLAKYELLVSVRDEGQNVRIFTQTSGDIIKELLVMVGGKDEFVLLSFIGDMNLNSLAKLANTLDIDGAEHLELID